MQIAILTVASLSLVMSTAAVAMVIIGAKKANTEISRFKITVNTTLDRFRDALSGVKL